MNAMTVYHSETHPWFLIQLKPNGLARAEQNLERQHVTTFMPRLTMPIPKGKVQQPAPLFPGYLFATFDPLQTSFSTINSTYGVSRLVLFNSRSIQGLPPALIKDLQARCDDQGFLKPIADLAANEVVRITQGPFKDFVATVEKYSAKDRILVLFDLMGQVTRAEIPVANLARVNAA
jgi:transcriptional antiterminator RfaH